MKKFVLWMSLAVVLCLSCVDLRAQDAKPDAKDVVGTWQGTLQAGKALRLVLKISRDDGKLKATMYSIDQVGQPMAANAVSMQGAALEMSIVAIGGSYEGKLSSDGNTIAGTFTQGGPLPLDFTRATTATAWSFHRRPRR